MSKPSDALANVRPFEAIIANCLRGLAEEMAEHGYGLHGWAIQLICNDFERLANLERENGLDPERALRIVLAKPH